MTSSLDSQILQHRYSKIVTNYTFKKAMQDAATNGAKPFNKAKLAAMLEITPDECQRWPILDPNKRSHKRTHKAKRARPIQIAEGMATIG